MIWAEAKGLEPLTRSSRAADFQDQFLVQPGDLQIHRILTGLKKQWKEFAGYTGFEPVISAVTGQRLLQASP